MASRKGGIGAKQLVREYGASLESFTQQVDALVTKLSLVEASLPIDGRRREVCAAIWAAISASFEASALSNDEKARLSPLMQEVLIPYWRRHCAPNMDLAALLEERAADYLRGSDRKSQIVTAGSIVRQLLTAIGTQDEPRAKLEKPLVPLFAHRMLGDIHYIDDLKSRVGIQLSVLAMMYASFGLADACEPALRLLRLS